ncbi:MAG: hypothetical protein CSB02_00525 [Bacteroidia bacterium]|nr:MAG: hypothetical protein CSB02_00525 [Bacteroidia bacterium]
MGAVEMDMFAKASKPIRYPWWKRWWRIYRFLRRQKRKRKQEERRKKQEKKDKQKAASQWRKKVRRRARRMAFKRWLRPKRKSAEEKAEAKRLKRIEKKARRRKRAILLKAIFNPKPKPAVVDYKKLEREILRQKEQAFLIYKRRRLRRFVFKRYRQIIWDWLRGKGLPPKRVTHKKRPNVLIQVLGKDNLVIMLNSLMAFLIAHYFITISSRMATSTAALLFDIQSILYNANVTYILEDGAWTSDAIKTIFSAGPVIALILALVSALIFSQVYKERGVLKLVLLWMVFIGLNNMVMGVLVGSLMGQNVGYVIMYSYFMDTDKMIVAIAMLALALLLGYISTRVWIHTANSYYTCSLSQNRLQFVIAQVLLPFLIGNGIIFLVTLPDFNLFDMVLNISLFAFLLPVLVTAKQQPDLHFEVEEEVNIRWRYKMFIFALVFIAAIRYALHIGIRFPLQL